MPSESDSLGRGERAALARAKRAIVSIVVGEADIKGAAAPGGVERFERALRPRLLRLGGR